MISSSLLLAACLFVLIPIKFVVGDLQDSHGFTVTCNGNSRGCQNRIPNISGLGMWPSADVAPSRRVFPNA